MPQPQKFYRTDPDGKGRGAGYYYARTVPKGKRRVHVHSKYSPFRDGSKKAKVIKKRLQPKYDHVADRKKGFSTHRTHVGIRKKRVFGWF